MLNDQIVFSKDFFRTVSINSIAGIALRIDFEPQTIIRSFEKALKGLYKIWDSANRIEMVDFSLIYKEDWKANI